MKARLYRLATAATTLALLVQVLDAGREVGLTNDPPRALRL